MNQETLEAIKLREQVRQGGDAPLDQPLNISLDQALSVLRGLGCRPEEQTGTWRVHAYPGLPGGFDGQSGQVVGEYSASGVCNLAVMLALAMREADTQALIAFAETSITVQPFVASWPEGQQPQSLLEADGQIGVVALLARCQDKQTLADVISTYLLTEEQSQALAVLGLDLSDLFYWTFDGTFGLAADRVAAQIAIGKTYWQIISEWNERLGYELFRQPTTTQFGRRLPVLTDPQALVYGGRYVMHIHPDLFTHSDLFGARVLLDRSTLISRADKIEIVRQTLLTVKQSSQLAAHNLGIADVFGFNGVAEDVGPLLDELVADWNERLGAGAFCVDRGFRDEHPPRICFVGEAIPGTGVFA